MIIIIIIITPYYGNAGLAPGGGQPYLMVRLGSLALVCNVPQEVNRIVIEVVGYRERMQCMCFGKKKEMFDVKEQ